MHRGGFALLIVAVVTLPAVGAAGDLPASIFVRVGAGLHTWRPGLDSAAVAFETHGMQALRIDTGLALSHIPLFAFHFATGLGSDSRQDELIEAHQAEEQTLREMFGFVDLLSLILRREPNFLQRLLAVRVVYYEDLYTARSDAQGDFAYFPWGSGVDLSVSPGVAYGYTIFPVGTHLSFETRFKDLRVEASVLAAEHVFSQDNRVVVRVGWFHSRWDKVSESAAYTLEELPILQDTRLEASGPSLTFISENLERTRGVTFRLDLGVANSDLDVPLDYTAKLVNDQKIQYVGGECELRLAGRIGGHRVSAGWRGVVRHWDVMQPSEDTLLGESVQRLENDVTTQLYGLIEFDFNL